MAEDAVSAAIKSGKLKPTNECVTDKLRLVGGDGWEPAYFTVLAQQYLRMKKTTLGGKVVPGVMDTAAARHLSQAYGVLAERVAAIAQVCVSLYTLLGCNGVMLKAYIFYKMICVSLYTLLGCNGVMLKAYIFYKMIVTAC